ncbi:hypothetical protein [Novosphingobium sp.]|uniref:hypothetical protein n=1 Tax=Novosphingobium sp. TaxID=1874826 RepID=UPI0025FFEFE6|nr:hypothetical protein [Novosphingobium sp.]
MPAIGGGVVFGLSPDMSMPGIVELSILDISLAGGGFGANGFPGARVTRFIGFAFGPGATGLRGLAAGFAARIFMPGIEP